MVGHQPVRTTRSQSRLLLKMTMASDSRGSGQIFWQEKGVTPVFFRDRSRGFEIQHDGQPHEYSISWSAKHPVVAVRIDPSKAAGEITIFGIRLIDGDGNEVYRWKF